MNKSLTKTISTRKRVLFLVPAFAEGAGGAERVISSLLRHLDHTRFECHLALVGTGTEFLDGIPVEVTVHPLGVSRMRYALPAIVRLARRLRPQTILSTVIYVNAMLMLGKPFLAGRPKILLREAIVPSAFLREEARYPRATTWLYRHLYPKADRIICLFDGMIDDMIEHFDIPREKLVRIYNPVDIDVVRRLADEARSPYDSSGRHLVAMGRLQHQKAYDVLLQALPAVLKAYPDTDLSILGEGPLEAELKRKAVDLAIAHAVNFRGFHKNPWPYVKHADLFILSSRFEGLPNALLEVAALGVPVVATDCPGGVREIQKSAPQILLVPPENPESLGEGIIAALNAPSKLHATALEVEEFLRRFDITQIAQEYAGLF